MFDNSRFMTSSIQERVSLELQYHIWRLIDECKVKGFKMDFLQIFELSTGIIGGQTAQIIIHRQEEPLYRHIHIIASIERPLKDEKIWVIDNSGYSTMLFPRDY